MQDEVGAQVPESNRRSKQDLRLWLRMLACTNLIERDVRDRLRRGFAVTLPRFDFLAVLYRAEVSLTMGELSSHLMVSNGNITALAERLEAENLITRTPWPEDRRTLHVTLTAQGTREFERMAVEHETWVAQLFSGLTEQEVDDLWRLLGVLKHSLDQPEQQTVMHDKRSGRAAGGDNAG